MSATDIGSDLTDKTPPAGSTVGEDGNKDAGTKSSHKSDAKTWQDRYDISYNNKTNSYKKWSEWYKALYAIKTYKNIGAWRSKVFVPIMAFKVWSILAKLLALDPGFSVKIYDKLYSQADEEKIQKANLKLRYDYDNPMLDESIRDRMFDSGTDAIVIGTGFGLANWCTEDRKTYTDFKQKDGTIDYAKANVTTETYGYNDLDPINPFDVFDAPGKRSFENKPWLIIKCPSTSRADLLKDANFDEKTVNSLVAIADRQDKLASYKQSRDDLLSKSKDQESIDNTVDSFDKFLCYEKCEDGLYLTVFVEAKQDPKAAKSKEADGKKTNRSADGDWIQLFDARQPSWHDKYPLVPSYIRRKPHQAWGESIFETTESMANAFNDILNQYMDNLNISGNGGILMHSTDTIIYDFYYGPGGEIRYSGTAPTFETPTPPNMEIFSAMMEMLEKGIDWGTVSDFATGNQDPKDPANNTAQGIQLVQEAAGQIVTFMKSNHMQTLKAVGNRWLSNNRQFMEDPLALVKTVNGKDKPYSIDRTDFTDKMVCTIDEDSMQPATQTQRTQTLGAWITQMFALQTQSFIAAGIVPPAKGVPPTQPPVNGQGEAISKPLYLDFDAIGAEVCNEYGRPDFQDFIKSAEQSPDHIPVLSDMIDKIRELESDGELETPTAQDLINQLEATHATQEPQPGQAPGQPVMAGGPGQAVNTPQPAA